ncbi:MAG: hypothetical protein JWM88_2811 [Verrucomicrobia bacterium]|nr:hypothetical protein [Verrucomicrobiota bacterium]
MPSFRPARRAPIQILKPLRLHEITRSHGTGGTIVRPPTPVGQGAARTANQRRHPVSTHTHS